MIINSLSLLNFRVFNGIHDVELAPSKADLSSHKNIILFGGLNGAGKTSILTAVRLALYGRAAFGFNMTSSEYQDQLANLIHNGNGVGQSHNNASIELVFTYNQQGQENEYKVIRSWDRGKKDKLFLYRNDVPESYLTYEQCQAFLNELIPAGIADLFFFDGEKIAELAEDKSGNVLQTAVRRLLGIDVVERLKNDLNIFLKPYQGQAMPQTVKTEIKGQEEKRKDLEKDADILLNNADLEYTKVDGIDKKIEAANAKIMNLGGAWAKTKKQEEAKVNELLIEKKTLEASIRKEMEGSLPFTFAQKTLTKLLQTLDAEAQTKQQQAFTKELATYIGAVQARLPEDESTTQAALNAINDTFNDYQTKADTAAILLDLSERERSQVVHQTEVAAPASYTRFTELKARLAHVTTEIDNAAINIGRAPDEKRVAEQLELITNLNQQKTAVTLKRNNTLNDAKEKINQAIEIAKNVQSIHDKYKSTTNVNEAVSNAASTNQLLNEFATELTTMKVKQLEAEFIKSYQKLARKDDLDISARINIETFDVELIDERGSTINRKDLSAGEKQIYAIAILEALGKTSGRKLPIIIDTPLGRLDSHHRDKLVERYFPDASHQVIILSTDTEVDEGYFNQGRFGESISHAFEIQFDGKTKSSKLKEGYFWQQEPTPEAV
jgi:DNA sulfur modification protein DndD